MTGRGLILSAPASGSGKTIVTAGLARLMRHRGLRVATAKAGPDFVDPTFHEAAIGTRSLNLDVWGMRPAALAALVADLEASADLVFCEGVMGLFDGTGHDGETGSTAELALRTGWPVVLIVDARGQGASVAALLRGFATHQLSVPIAGVIFNNVASARHTAMLTAAVARHLPSLPCLGALPFDPSLIVPKRHLGLVPAGELDEIETLIDRCATRIATALYIDRLLRLPRPAALAASERATFIPPLGQRIAVAHDKAFCFTYPVMLESWRREGAELMFFSPLEDEPPQGLADSVYLPGGYPELWAGRLASAAGFLAGLRQAAEDRKPIYGECGGYMVLGKGLVDGTGCRWQMAGLLPLVTSFAERRLHLGYRSAALLGLTPLGPAGARFRGHEFHYATVVSQEEIDPLFAVGDAAGKIIGAGGLQRGSVFGSFLHLIDRAPEQ